ncbi:MAG: SusC/RagA family TonB-linked outer membrane protein [Bacteroidaceae bacterium]|nr:SusC/RagA family TonB-linked outer membrane protein [Bacteroidaceae bacterium]
MSILPQVIPNLRRNIIPSNRYFIVSLFCLVALCLAQTSLAQTPTDPPQSVPMTTVTPQRVPGTPSGEEVLLQGVVKDASGETLPGANIRIRETKGGAVADADGKFTISLPKGQDVTVQFSFVGMKPIVKKYDTKRNHLNQTIVLEESGQMDEVVVTGLFDYRSATFTGSAMTYTQEDLKLVGNNNVLKIIQSIDPSFVVDMNSVMGSNPNYMADITIRGNASFGGLQGEYSGNPNAPLFILDGFEATQQQIFDLDMNRVKSVTILKDGAAKAIYGSKASNGVIVVETILPEAGRLRITYTGDLNVEVPDLTSYNLCNAEEKLQVEQMSGRYSSESPYYQALLDEQYNSIAADIARGVDTYWLSQPLRTGVGHKHTAYIEGGTEEMRYSANLMYNNVAGVMKKSNRQTLQGNVSLSYRYKQWMFRNSLSVTGNTANDSPYGTFSDYVSVNPYFAPQDAFGNTPKVLGIYTSPGANGSATTYYNPLYNATIGTKNFSKYTEVVENFYLEYRPIDDLRFTARLGFTHQNNKREDFYPGDHTRFYDWTGDRYFQRGSYNINNGESNSLSIDITGNYSHTWGKHMLLANAAYSMQNASSNTEGMTAWGFLNNHVDYITFAKQYAEGGKPSGSESRTRSLGITGAANYSFDERYLFDASIRFNGSSVFGSDNRWGTFWSAGLGWNLHKEHFMSDARWLNLCKFRVTYGLTGNQNFSPYQSKATYKFYDNIIYDNISGAYLMGMPNPNLKWQQTGDFTVGLDLGLWKRLNLRFDWYNSRTHDALIAMSIPTSTGFTSYMENLGNVENKGVEATANWRFFQKGQSYMSLTGSIAHNVNRVTKINEALSTFNREQDAETTTSPIIRYEEGQSMSAIWAVQSLGIDPATGREMFLKKDGTTTYSYTTDDYIIAGDANPKVHGTLGLNGEVKGIGLSLLFSYQMGGDYYNQTLVDRVENVNIANNVDRRVFSDTWNAVGDVALYKHISATPTTTYASTRFVQRNNMLDLTSLSAYYDFKYCSWLKKAGLERMRVTFYMNDVFHLSTIKAERGLSYPYARTFSLSLTATF